MRRSAKKKKTRKILIVLATIMITSVIVFVLAKPIDNKIIYNGEYSYMLNRDDTATIVRYENINKENTIVIPAYIDGYEVNSIRRNAYDCSGVSSVEVGDNITHVESNAFYNCNDLLMISWPADLISVKPFLGIERLKEVNISFGQNGFMNDFQSSDESPWSSARSTVSKVTIEEGIRYIGNYCFADFSNLKSLSVPDTIESIGKYAFHNDKKLDSLVLPFGLTAIGTNAFNSDTESESQSYITIPQSVNYLGIDCLGKNYRYIVHKDSKAEKYLKDNGLTFQTVDLNFVSENIKMVLGSEDVLALNSIPAEYREDITYSSSDQNVAVIDETGRLISLSTGKTVIMAHGYSGNGKCTVEVIADGRFESCYRLMSAGSTFKADLKDFEGVEISDGKIVSYSSSDPRIAQVSDDGTVKAVNSGKCSIIVSDGQFKTCSYLIRVYRPVEKIELDRHSLVIPKGRTYKIKTQVYPKNADNKALTFTSDNSEVVKVSSNGNITALANGTATITVSSNDGSFVSNKIVVTVARQSFSIETKNVILMPDKQFQLRFSSNTDDLVFTSSDPSIATVDQQGRVSGIKPGKSAVVIRNNKKSSCSNIPVTVMPGYSYGFDISRWNGNHLEIEDFQSAHDMEFDFIYIRAGYGNEEKDINFEKNYKMARQAGFDIGAYHYILATSVSQAKEEAGKMLEWINGKKFEYPIMIDIEDSRQKYLSKSRFNDILDAYIKVMNDHGYKCIVYSYSAMLNKANGTHDYWVAQWYDDTPDYYQGNYSIWQFCDNGTIDGFAGRVDLDICLYDYPTFIKENHYNGY